jgi:hypothetical protein
MDEIRLKHDLKLIRKKFPAFVFLNHDPPYMRVDNIPTNPNYWETPSTTLAIKLPPDYPNTQPVAYAPARLTPRDGVDVKHFLRAKKHMRDAFPGGPWNWFCVHDIPDWEPKSNGTTSFVNLFTVWLDAPWKKNPLGDE